MNGRSIPELDPRRIKMGISKPMKDFIPFLYHRTQLKNVLGILSKGLTPGGPSRDRDKRRVNCLSIFPPMG